MQKRLFLAINLPPDLQENLGIATKKLAKSNERASIKWVSAHLLHITIHFLGNIGQEKIPKICGYLKEIVGRYSKSSIVTGNINAFPNLHNPRVIFMEGKEKGHVLHDLQLELVDFLIKEGIQVSNRPWNPHITLGRVKGYDVSVQIPRLDLEPQEFKVESVELMESVLGEQGPEYSVI